MTQAVSTSITRRSVVAGLALTAAPVAVLAGAGNAYAQAQQTMPEKSLYEPECPLLAHRVISLPRGNSVAFGLKRTLDRVADKKADITHKAMFTRVPPAFPTPPAYRRHPSFPKGVW